MSSSSSVSLDFLGVQNAPEANGKVMKGSSNLEMEFGPEKRLSKLRCMVSFANALNLSRSVAINDNYLKLVLVIKLYQLFSYNYL